MGLRGIIKPVSTNPLERLANNVKELGAELGRLRSVVRRDCLKAQGYEVEVRSTPVHGLYLVNKIDGDPNYGNATLLGQ